MAKAKSNKDNLTKIKGVGPKIASLFNAAGIMTFKQLATAKKKNIEDILKDAGPRYQSHDPTVWMKAAAELAKGSVAPKTTTKPKATKPKTTAKPKAATKPKATKPKTTAKPKAATKPKATTKPKTKTKTKTKAPKKKPAKPATSESASKIKVGELDLPKFRHIMRELNGNVETLSKMTVRKYRKEAKRDAERMLKGMKKDLRRWTRLLEKGHLTTEDFEYLVKSNVASCKMGALESSGLAIIRMQAYRSSLFNMVIDTVFGLALKALA